VDELGLDLVRDLLAEVGGVNAEETMPERLTTTSLASARAFLEGEEHYRAGRFRPAIESYEEAIAEDSTFALPAWRAYMALLYVGLGEQQRAMEEKLLAVLDDLPARDRTLARLRLRISGDSVRSVVPALDAVERYPDDAEAWYMLGEVRHHEPGIAGGGHEGALEAFERAIELAPGFIPYYYHPVEYAIGAGDRDRTEVLMAVLEEAEVDDAAMQRIRGGMEVFLGPLEDARQKLRDDPTLVIPYLFTSPISPGMIPRVWEILEEMPVEGDVRATDVVSAWAMTAGRQQEAFDLMRTIPIGNGTRVTLARHHQDVLGALPGFDLAEEFDPSYCGPKDIPFRTACHEKVAMHDVDMGRYDQVRRFIAEQDSIADQHEVPRAAIIHRRYARSLAGYLAWKEGDIERALREYGEARRLDGFAVTARWHLAEVFIEAGRALEAVDLFLSIDDSPTWSPFSRLRAAEVLEDLGDSERAAAHYRAALSAWPSADEGFEPRARAEAGLARVGG
jgi:tetratricopeptide (TPR) repeat protein